MNPPTEYIVGVDIGGTFTDCVVLSKSGKIFIGSTKSGLTPDANSAWRSRSIHLSRHRAPDDSATAIYENVWFSAAPVPA